MSFLSHDITLEEGNVLTTSASDRTKLASNFTDADYQSARAEEDKHTIAKALRRRFKERYIEPVTGANKHGFTMMAIACLMIESLESFRQGRETSNGKGREVFCKFFDTSPRFAEFKNVGAAFYRHIRCGILHQAETTGGWRIIRQGPLFDSASLTINSTRFLKRLSKELDVFCAGLETTGWDSEDWQNVNKKMTAICKNCHR